MDYPDDTFSVVYADPPWSYNDKGFGKRPKGAESLSFAPEAGRYSTMTLSQIKDLGPEVKRITTKNAALLLWATSPLMPEAFEVIDSWGFKYKTVAFCWSKVTSRGIRLANLGQWTMGNIELCLLGTRGSPKRMVRNIRQLVIEERRKHSAKPVEVRDRISTLFGDVPKLEMFAREEVDGWSAWGDEV